ncbi:MAG: hypothetical protein HY716_08875 [Planctomycetes bacterium]|nr:hypothetical protein [Planctomycetota bacterium]
MSRKIMLAGCLLVLGTGRLVVGQDELPPRPEPPKARARLAARQEAESTARQEAVLAERRRIQEAVDKILSKETLTEEDRGLLRDLIRRMQEHRLPPVPPPAPPPPQPPSARTPREDDFREADFRRAVTRALEFIPDSQMSEREKLEREEARLAGELRRTPVERGDEREQIRAKLQKVVSQLFDVRERERAQEVESLRRRLDDLTRLLEKRKANRDRIIERRLRHLQGEPDELEW